MGLTDDDDAFVDDIDSGYFMGGTHADIKYSGSRIDNKYHSPSSQHCVRRANSISSMSSHGIKLTDTIKRTISSPRFNRKSFGINLTNHNQDASSVNSVIDDSNV